MDGIDWVDIPLEILHKIVEFMNTPSDFFNINLVCKKFNDCGNMLRESKAFQFVKLVTSTRENYYGKSGFYLIRNIESYVLPNGWKHGLKCIVSKKRRLYESHEVNISMHYGYFQWGKLIKEHTVKL